MALRRRRRDPRRVAAALVIGLIGAAAAGCRAEPGSTFACACTFLTDFDDTSHHEVTVCAPTAERAEAMARGCAQSGAPAPVQGCACRPVGVGAGACTAGDCRVK